MELAQQWLQAQKGTPSFVVGNGMPSAFDQHDSIAHMSILDAPLPASLAVVTPGRARSHATSSRTPQPSARLAHTPGRSVHDDLIAKGKLYQQRREALQEKAVREQIQQLKSPRISAEARNMPVREPFHTRFLKNYQRKNEEKEVQMHMVQKDDDEQLRKLHTFKPKLSARGRRATGKVHLMIADQHDQWQARRDEHLEAERAKRIVEELQEVRDGPDINARSQRLAARRLEKEGLSGMGHAEAMLERDRLTKLALWERQQKESIASFNPNPKITAYAATLPRSDEDVGERLYQAAFEAAERKAERARLAIEAQQHAPRISKVAQTRSRSQRIEDDLMERHLQSLAERERAVLESDRRNRHQHTPAINPVSDAIAAQLPVSSRERLTAPYRSASSFSDPMTDPSAERTRLVAPSHTSQRSSSHLSPDARAEILARQEERRRARMEALRVEAQNREMAECTFQPYTSPGPTTTPRGHSNTGNVQPLPDRSQQWAKKREMWRQEQLRAREQNEVAECTFAPMTHDIRDVQRALTPHRTIYGGEGKAWGTDEFVNRQRLARIRAEEEQRKQLHTGTTWKNRVTVPEEPKLGRSEATTPRHIKSLQRPIDAPSYAAAAGDDYKRGYSAGSEDPPYNGMVSRWGDASQAAHIPTGVFGSVPNPAHFSGLHRADLGASATEAAPQPSGVAPIVPLSVHQHRAAFGY